MSTSTEMPRLLPEKMVTMTCLVWVLRPMYDDINDIHVFSVSVEVWKILGWNERRDVNDGEGTVTIHYPFF